MTGINIDPSAKNLLMHSIKKVKAIIKEINYKFDINTLHHIEDDKEIKMNDIARIILLTTSRCFDSYKKHMKSDSH